MPRFDPSPLITGMTLFIREYINGQIRAEYRIPKADGESSIGRSDNATYTIGGSFPKQYQGMISGIHATVKIEGGKVWIRDGNGNPSRYGIYKGAHKITNPQEVREGEVITLFKFREYKAEFRFDCDTVPPKSDDTSTPNQILETILEQFEKLREENDRRFAHMEQNQSEILGQVEGVKVSVSAAVADNAAQSKQLQSHRKMLGAVFLLLIIVCGFVFTGKNSDEWNKLALSVVTVGVGALAIAGKVEEKK